MLVSRVFCRVARRASSLNQCRLLVSSSRQEPPSLNLSSEFSFAPGSLPKATLFNYLIFDTTISQKWLSLSKFPEPFKKQTNKPANGQAPVTDEEIPKASAEAKREKEEAYIRKLECLLTVKEDLFKNKRAEMNRMQDSVLRGYADTLAIMDRTRIESENSKKIAIQNFAKSLLDVADNLGRASAVVKDSFSKIDQTKDSAGAVPLLKTLLEGVEMTNKQLAEVFRKYGVEKYDPMNEQFATVLKLGYILQVQVIRPGRVIRPAEVVLLKKLLTMTLKKHQKIKEKNHGNWNAQFSC